MFKPPEPSYAGYGGIVYMAQNGSKTPKNVDGDYPIRSLFSCMHDGDPKTQRANRHRRRRF